MTAYTERGTREIGTGLRDALARLRRRKDELRHQVGVMEAEISDLGHVEAALLAAAEIVAGKK